MVHISSITNNIRALIGELSNNPFLCAMLVCIFGMMTLAEIRTILCRLNEMHRSKSSIKKINKCYSFWKRTLLLHVWDHCLHAKGFCRILVCYYHVRSGLLLISILLTMTAYVHPLFSDINVGFSAGTILLLDIPVIILHFVLQKYPFQRLKHEYRFEKYNHSSEHSKLL